MSFDAGQSLISNKFHLNIFFCFLAWETLLNAYDHSIQCNCWMHDCCLYSQSCHDSIQFFCASEVLNLWVAKGSVIFLLKLKKIGQRGQQHGEIWNENSQNTKKMNLVETFINPWRSTEWFLQELSKFMKTFKPAVSFCSWSPISANIHNRELTIFVYLWSLCWIQYVSIIWPSYSTFQTWTNNITCCQIHLASF